jgi:energy-coupling factor transporter ATP-binding protein EcfA2
MENKIALPFAMSQLEVAHFQGITHLFIEQLPINKQWIFLTGENGFGKTSILKAIAKALAGDEDYVASLPKESRLTLHGVLGNQAFSYKAASKQLPNYDFPMAAYGASRFQVSKIDPSEFSTSKYGKKTYSLFADDGLLMNLDRFLMDAERDDLPTFQRLKAIFLKTIPNLADLKSVLSQKVRRMMYYEKSDTKYNYKPVFLSELGAGYRSILTLIGDMVQRLTTYSGNSLDDLKGVVLIDEFDAHLHPKYQYQLPQLLSEVFPKVQFIVATHSPIPILGAKPDTYVVLKVHRTQSEGVTVERLDDDIEIQKLSVNALLTSDIFDFGAIFANGATPDTLEPFDNYKEIQEKERLKKLLQLKTVLNRLK